MQATYVVGKIILAQNRRLVFKFKILLHSYFLSFYFLQVGQISRKRREADCELFAEYLLEKDCRIATWKILRRKLCGIFCGEKLFFNGQFSKIQAIKSSLQQRFHAIAGLALAI